MLGGPSSVERHRGLARAILAPSSTLQEPYHRRRAALHQAIVLTLIALLTLLVVASSLLLAEGPLFSANPLIDVLFIPVALTAYAAAYALGRTRHHDVAALLTTTTTFTLVLVTGYLPPDPASPYTALLALPIPVLLAVLFLPRRTSTAFLLLGVAAAVVPAVVRPDPTYPAEIPLLIVALMAPVYVASTLQRRDLHQLHVQANVIAESEEQFRQLAENVNEVFWLATGDLDRMIYVNPAADEVLGVPADQLVQDPEVLWELVHPDDRPRVEEALPDLATGGYDLEHRIVRPDGVVRWVRSRSFPITGAEGEVTRVAGVVRDVTARRAASEKQAREAERRARARELEGLTLAAAHQLQEPLRTVTSHIQLLARRLGTALAPRDRRTMDDIVGGVDRMVAVVDGLRAYTEAVLRVDPETTTSLRTALDHALADLEPSLEAREATVAVEGDLPHVRGDARSIRTLLTHLVDNAVHHGGARIHVASTLRDGEVLVKVVDDGPGIPEHHRHRVLELFHQLERREDGRVGVGLALARRTVEGLGGNLWLQEGDGGGTAACFTLPVSDA